MRTGIVGVAVAALLLAAGAGSVGAAEPNFKPVYDSSGTRITNIPDPTKDLDAFAKYFIWQKVGNSRDYLTRDQAPKMPDKQWDDLAVLDKKLNQKVLRVKEVKILLKEELAKYEAQKGSKKDDGKK